jgi:hypothetical protein
MVVFAKSVDKLGVRPWLFSFEHLVEIQQIIVGIHHEMVLTEEIRKIMLHSTEIAVVANNPTCNDKSPPIPQLTKEGKPSSIHRERPDFAEGLS